MGAFKCLRRYAKRMQRAVFLSEGILVRIGKRRLGCLFAFLCRFTARKTRARSILDGKAQLALQATLARFFVTWKVHTDMPVFFAWGEQVLDKIASVQEEVRELEMKRCLCQDRRRSMSEPRLNRSEKQDLVDRIFASSSRLAESRCAVAEAKLEAAKQWYEDAATRYIQERDHKTILQLGPGGHLLDHRYAARADIPEPPGLGSTFSRAIHGLGQLARADNEALLRRKLHELEAYCQCIEEENERLACQVLELEQGLA